MFRQIQPVAFGSVPIVGEQSSMDSRKGLVERGEEKHKGDVPVPQETHWPVAGFLTCPVLHMQVFPA